ncbi:MAG: CapA family protein [Bacteroidaceae bacterium]|nr:CapA family protein [Bacteroidaceae bacterium]
MTRSAIFIGIWLVCTLSASAQALDSISLYFAGDMMQHKAQLQAARRPNGTYDYSGCFIQVIPEIEAADIAVCNFETTLGGAPYTGYPQFCSPDAFALAVRDAGFDIFLTANNHCLDRRNRGLIRTLDILDSLGIGHLGTYRNQAERDSLYPYIIEHGTMRIALLNYTYDTNGIPVAPPCIVNYIDTTQIKADVIRARQLHADCIIACMHWGTEYRTEPDASQKKLERWLYSIGVNHIIGGHPHVVQPVRTLPHEYYADRHLTVWSLGNYISNMTAPRTDHGLAVTLHLLKIGAATTLRYYDLHPNQVHKRDGSFCVVPE